MPESQPIESPQVAAGCPKRMEFGPCGGVEFDGRCEVAEHPCVFLDTPTVRWGADAPPPPTPAPGAERMRATLARRRIVVADFPATALDADSIAECGDALRGRVDAVLAGDAPSSRVQFPPSYRAHLIRAAGLEAWAGINCRDRNRVAIEGELAGLAHAGAAGVLCVTGDHTLTGARPDAAPVFDLDSTRAAALARSAGHLVAVAESPLAPPTARRAARLLEKQRAGAEICFVNHAGGVDPVRAFLDEVRSLGVQTGFIPCVPLVFDRASAELLLTFTTLVLPPGYLDGILSAADPRRAGIDAAVALSRRLLELDGVVGVNLSGGPGPSRPDPSRPGPGGPDRGELAFAQAVAIIGEELAS